MSSYQIEIPNTRVKPYQLITFLIAAANALAFGFYYINTIAGAQYYRIIEIGFFVAVAGFAFFIINRFTRFLRSFIVEISFIICAACWLLTQNYFLGLMLLLFAVMGLMTKKKPVIVFSKTGIHYPSFPSNTFSWVEVAWVMLKDGILSIEMKDNRLMQFTLDKNISAGINQSEFNNYCETLVKTSS